MMQQNRSYEQREPEKTPLVDMVFLLLIFFFVALSERASIGQWMGSGDIRQDLPSAKDLGPVGTEHEVVLEVLDPSNPRNISALRAVRQKLLSCSPSCPVPAVPEVEAGFWIVTTP
ncbi:MAG: biopolymer transporter ExbD, partial [candidate division KSB1 bacterium]|nr:biopolymer transporter ExbD [candidate division KSB1 bacterium]